MKITVQRRFLQRSLKEYFFVAQVLVDSQEITDFHSIDSGHIMAAYPTIID